jgi:hypothetical protein
MVPDEKYSTGVSAPTISTLDARNQRRPRETPGPIRATLEYSEKHDRQPR